MKNHQVVFQIVGETREVVIDKMHQIPELQGIERLICLLSALSFFPDLAEYELLSSPEIIGRIVKTVNST